MRASLSRLFHAIKPIPVKTILWRLVRRPQRFALKLFPDLSRYFLISIAKLIQVDGNFENVLQAAILREAHERSTSIKLEHFDDEIFSLNIHGVSATSRIGHPFFSEHPGLPSLWRMTSSYLSFLMKLPETVSATELSAMCRLISAYTCRDAFKIPNTTTLEWHPYSASHRLINCVLFRSRYDNVLSEHEKSLLDASISAHTAFVNSSTEYDLLYNHLAKNLMALIISQAYRTGKIEERLVNNYIKIIEHQLEDDGGHSELCPMYHLLVLADLLVILAIDARLISDSHRSKISELALKMQNAAKTFTFSNSQIANFGDSWAGESPSIESLGIIHEKPTIDANNLTINFLPYTGYYKASSPTLELVMDVGHAGAQDNPGHAHDDFLSIEVLINDRKWIMDYGVASYAAGKERDTSRSAQNHNGPTFDGSKGIDAWGSFRVGKRSPKPVTNRVKLNNFWELITATHVPLSSPHTKVSRSIYAHPEYGIFIRDRWYGIDKRFNPRSTFLTASHPDCLASENYQFWSNSPWEATDKLCKVFPTIGQSKSAWSVIVTPKLDDAILYIGPSITNPTALLDELEAMPVKLN